MLKLTLLIILSCEVFITAYLLETVSDVLTPQKSTLNYSPYYKGPVCTPNSQILHPKSIPEVVSIVREVIRKGTTCKPLGALHSATDIVCTNGIPIDMRGIGGMFMNYDKSVTVGAGLNLHEVAEFLKKNGRGLKTIPAYGNITIGGAVGTGSHGSSLRYTSSISEQVIGVTIVDGFGRLQNIRQEEDLKAFRVHLGLLGILVQVTLRTEPLYKVRGFNYVMSDQALLDGSFIDMVKGTDQISIYWFPSFHRIVVANWTIVDVHTEGEAWTNDHVPSTYFSFHAVGVPAIETIQAVRSTQLLNIFQALFKATILTKVPDFPPIYTEDGVTLKNPAVGYYHRMFAPICQATGSAQCPWFHGPFNLTFLDNEMGLPIEKVPQLAATVKDIVGKYSAVFPLQGILLRFSAASETYMSTAYGRDTCHFEFYTLKRYDDYRKASLGIGAYQTILQSLAFNFSGRSHWGKSGAVYHNTHLLSLNLDPRARHAFLEKMKKYDPHGVFLNDFGWRLMGKGNKMNIDPLVTHCALMDNCICKVKTDCAVGQTCATIEGYPDYPACINPGSFLDILDPNPNYSSLKLLNTNLKLLNTSLIFKK